MQADHLPTTEQIIMAGERPILAALDTLLALTIRTLLAEHPTLESDAATSRASNSEEPVQALAASAIILARSLREVVDGYCLALERVYKDGRRPRSLEDDLPF